MAYSINDPKILFMILHTWIGPKYISSRCAAQMKSAKDYKMSVFKEKSGFPTALVKMTAQKKNLFTNNTIKPYLCRGIRKCGWE